jgi:hypothetical protein
MEKQRTIQQNKALHAWFKLLSDYLNENGLDMRVVLKPDWRIWWTPESVKENLFKPLMEAMYQKESTTELNTAEINKVYEQIMFILGEKYGIHVPFPSHEETDEYIKSLDK